MTKPYHVAIAPAARRQILALSAKQQKHIVQLAKALAINPRPPLAKRITGMTGLYSETINHDRVIYKIEEQEILILVVKSV